ncbi:hypothetical protein D3C81_1574630 [compost metagenome]
MGIAVDRILKLGTGIADIVGIDENGRDTRVDQSGFESPDTGHLQVIHQVAGREHRPAAFALIGRRIKELQLHLGRREGHTVEFEVAGFLHFALGNRHMSDDGLADVGLPDTHGGNAIARDARRLDQATADGERTDSSRQVAAVAAPVDEGLVDGHLAEQVVDVVLGLGAG